VVKIPALRKTGVVTSLYLTIKCVVCKKGIFPVLEVHDLLVFDDDTGTYTDDAPAFEVQVEPEYCENCEAEKELACRESTCLDPECHTHLNSECFFFCDAHHSWLEVPDSWTKVSFGLFKTPGGELVKTAVPGLHKYPSRSAPW